MNGPVATSPAPAAAPASGSAWAGPPWPLALLVLTALAGLLFGLRLLGPNNLTDNDQERPASYVLDALRNGNWFVQRDWTGDLTSKPPMYTWLAAGVSRLAGRHNLTTLYLPCALSMWGSSVLLWGLLYQRAGPRAALLAGVFLLANPLTAKLVALARTDAVFTFGVTLTAVLAFGAWERGRGWPFAWLAATFATLTKGPLGILLGFGGLLAWFRERRHGAASPWHPLQVLWAGLLLVIAGGWLWLAWNQAGEAVFNKLIRSELVGHVVNRSGPTPGVGLVLTPAYFLGRFAPWSLIAIWGLWLAWRHPEPEPRARRVQSFAAAWLLVGLVVLGLASHQRGDLVAPLLPAGAILAALPASGWFARQTTARWLGGLTALATVLALGFQIQHAGRRLPVFEESRGLASLGQAYLRGGGDPQRVLHADTPYALQWELGTMQQACSLELAARRLQLDPSLAVAVANRPRFETLLGPDAKRLRVLTAWPEAAPTPQFQILTLTLTPATPSP